jgi:preprotein translocase subunit YajC
MKEMIFAAVVFVLFFGMLFFSMIYSDTLRTECREKAMEKGVYSSAEIQVICK